MEPRPDFSHTPSLLHDPSRCYTAYCEWIESQQGQQTKATRTQEGDPHDQGKERQRRKIAHPVAALAFVSETESEDSVGSFFPPVFPPHTTRIATLPPDQSQRDEQRRSILEQLIAGAHEEMERKRIATGELLLRVPLEELDKEWQPLVNTIQGMRNLFPDTNLYVRILPLIRHEFFAPETYCGIAPSGWGLYLNKKQHNHLGRAIIALLSPEGKKVRSFHELSEASALNLLRFTKAYHAALEELFTHVSQVNFQFFNNNPSVSHAHAHLIPRYSDPVSFEGEVYRDDRIGRAPLPAQSIQAASSRTLSRLRDIIASSLEIQLDEFIPYRGKLLPLSAPEGAPSNQK